MDKTEYFLLASQLAAPDGRPLYLDVNNKNIGRAGSFLEAWLSDKSFCCDVRPGVVPIDIDEKQIGALHEYREIIKSSGHLWFEVASSGLQSAKRHFYIWVEDPQEREAFVAELKQVCGSEPVRVGQKMRLPGVLHRSKRFRAEIVNPSQADRFMRAHLPDWGALFESLRPSTRQELLVGPPTNDRSVWDQHICFQMVAEGVSPAEIVQLAAHREGHFSRKAREQGTSAQTLRYLLRSIQKAHLIYDGKPPLPRSRSDAEWMLDRFAHAVANAPVETFGGTSARLVLEGVVALLSEQSTFERAISERTLAEQTGLHRHTARKWLHHLQNQGWVEQSQAASRGKAAKYRANTFKLVPLLGTRIGGCVPKNGTTMKVSRCALHTWGYAGESGFQVSKALEALGGEGRTKDIAKGSGITPSNVGRVLNRLQGLGVVERVQHGVWQLTGTDSEYLAEETGAMQKIKARHALHGVERVLYGKYQLARLKQLTPEGSLDRYEVFDSLTVCDWETGELISICDLWNVMMERAA